MAYSLSPWLKPRFFITGTNRPLAGGLMYTYKAGTTDNATTYSDDSGTPNTNPIVLDSDGQCDLFLDDAVSYRIILKNSAGVTQFDKDRVASIGNTQVQSFNSVAALRLKTGTSTANSARTLGYYSAGDGGGNSFYYDTTSTATDNGGTVIKPTSVSGAGRWLALDNTRVSLTQFGAIASIDSTPAITACFAYANSLVRNGLVSTVKNAGCTVVIDPVVYSLDTISSPINILCNVENLGGDFVVPLAYAGTVLVVGYTTSGTNLADAHVELPVVRKPTSNNPLVAGSLGVQLRNINASRIYLSRINYFETALKCGGIGEGTVYNNIYLSQLGYAKVLISLSPASGGWCNSNNFFGGNLSQSTGFAGGSRLSGYRHLLVDGRSPATSVVGNSFYGTSFEGDVSEFTFDFNFAYNNTFFGCYHETGRAVAAVTVSGDTITRVAHGFAVGDKLTFQASVAPTGMFLAAAYYVVSVPNTDTFKVSLNKGGSAVTFSSTGTSVTCLLASVFRLIKLVLRPVMTTVLTT